jgi:hypothetical protein
MELGSTRNLFMGKVNNNYEYNEYNIIKSTLVESRFALLTNFVLCITQDLPKET